MLLEVNAKGVIVLPQSILAGKLPGTKYIVETAGGKIILRQKVDSPEKQSSTVLTLSERLEALLADVGNGITAYEVERISIRASFIGSTRLTNALQRLSTTAALLSLARILDKQKGPATFESFLNFAESVREEFKFSRPDEVIATIHKHRQWLNANEKFIIDLRVFRDKQIAHLDVSAIKSYFAGELFGVDMEDLLAPSLVEKADVAIEEILEMSSKYYHFLNSEHYDISDWRTSLRREGEEFVRCIVEKRNTSQLATEC